MVAISRTELSVSFLCGLRGYHVYKNEWKPILNETLPAIHEADNVYDRYAIAARKKLSGQTVKSTVGHLPSKEISRITRYIVLYGAVVRIRVTDVNNQKSLVQGGIEIPVEVLVKMSVDVRNEEAMKRYEALVSQNYKWQF